jgi:hypothetical protein
MRLCQCVRVFEIGRLPKGYVVGTRGFTSFSPADPVFGLVLSKNLTQLTQIFEQTSFFLIESSTYEIKNVCQT